MSTSNKVVNINAILKNGPDISRVISHSYSLLKLQSVIRSHIKTPESEHIYLASVSQDALILYTDSPAWAAKLRFRTQQLIDIIRNYTEFPQINTIRIKVSPALIHTEDTTEFTGLSPKTTKYLEEMAENMPDPQFKAAFAKLSKHGDVSQSQE